MEKEKEKGKRFKCDYLDCRKNFKTEKELFEHKRRHKGCNESAH